MRVRVTLVPSRHIFEETAARDVAGEGGANPAAGQGMRQGKYMLMRPAWARTMSAGPMAKETEQ